MTVYLVAVQDDTGREVTSWRGEAKVSQVAAVQRGDAVSIEVAGESVARGTAGADAALQCLRWRADEKLAEPVRTAVKTKTARSAAAAEEASE